MSCCKNKRSVASSRAIQNSRLNKKKKVVTLGVCQQLEKLGVKISLTVKNGILYLPQPFSTKIPAGSALVSMGCAGIMARHLHSIELEIAVIYKDPIRKQKFENMLPRETVTFTELDRVVSLSR